MDKTKKLTLLLIIYDILEFFVILLLIFDLFNGTIDLIILLLIIILEGFIINHIKNEKITDQKFNKSKKIYNTISIILSIIMVIIFIITDIMEFIG